jgi:hypothetical protein
MLHKIKNLFFSTLILAPLFTISVSYAQLEMKDYLSKFKSKAVISITDIKVPTVFEIDLNNLSSSNQLEVYNVSESKFIPSKIISNFKNENSFTVNNFIELNDGDYSTSKRFEVSEGGKDTVTLNLKYIKPIRTTNLSLSLADNVAWPTSIAISYINKNSEKVTALNKIAYNDRLSFPEVEANNFYVELYYSQPLVINEINFVDNMNSKQEKVLRFLAKPDNNYELYSGVESYVYVVSGEIPNLSDNAGVKKYRDNVTFIDNNIFKLNDIDNDGVTDTKDNCVNQSNPDQKDLDANGRGDVCDDYDKDSIINIRDNCESDPNSNQEDADFDGIGDKCDTEESRFTEKNSWVPWAAVVLAISVIGGLGFFVFRELKNKKELD